jgi:hypothetical protein
MGERIKVPLDGKKRGVHPDRKIGGPTLSLLELTPDLEEASRSPAPITSTATLYNELTKGSSWILTSVSGAPRLYVSSTHMNQAQSRESTR